MDIHLKIKELREKNNYSQNEVAKKLDLSRSRYSNYETGVSLPTVKILIEIAKLFGVSLDELAGLSGLSHINLSGSNIISGIGHKGNSQVIGPSTKEAEKEDKPKTISQLQEKINHLERENTALQQTIHTQNKLIHLLEKK